VLCLLASLLNLLPDGGNGRKEGLLPLPTNKSMPARGSVRNLLFLISGQNVRDSSQRSAACLPFSSFSLQEEEQKGVSNAMMLLLSEHTHNALSLLLVFKMVILHSAVSFFFFLFARRRTEGGE
jgi:hypothetical protein